MKRNVCAICALLLLLVLHYGCNDESTRINNNNGFQLTMDEGVTRSPESEDILKNMRLYCFTQGTPELDGKGGSWNSNFDHQILGVTHSGMTLRANNVRTGFWDLVMVSAGDAVLTPPISARTSSQALMYTYEPGGIQSDGSKKNAHEIWHRMLRLDEIQKDATTNASCAITRNAAKVEVIVDRAVDIDLNSTEHWFELHGVPNKISWSGTLLRTVSPGEYETSKSNPDVLPEPLTGKFTFEDNSTVEPGTYKSNKLTFIIPAHREASFWTNETTPNPNVLDADIITHHMSLSVSFTRPSGEKFVKKNVEIDRVTRCNGILQIHLKMKDVNLELETEVVPWEDEEVPGDFEAPYLNVSEVETTVYDGAASRIYFWSNQPKEEVYILKEGDGTPDVDAYFDRIAGPAAVNRYYNETEKSGYIDIANLNLQAATLDDVKIYLKAGNLQREITVKRSVSEQAKKGITTPYVGTFHRASQVGERLVTWKNDGPWTAYVGGPDASEVVIDRLPSPSFSDGSLYSSSPSNAEMGIISNDATQVSGMNTIYFRVGWKSMHSATDVPRYATITVRQGTNNPSGAVIQTLYLRQGEKASPVYGAPRSNPASFSPYNLTSASGQGTVSHRGGIPTQYPSQCGSYFQWMDHVNPNYAYPASGTGAVTPWNKNHPFYETYWTEAGVNMGDIYETCPANYRRVSDGGTIGEPTGTSELRQSLWADPSAASATNTLSGYYADGFFDRHSITSSPTGTANSAAGTGNEVAYKGKLFYNTSTKASLFFPAAGQRVLDNGALENTGDKGYYWTSSSTINTAEPASPGNQQPYISTRLRNTAVNIRCVAE